MRSRLPTGFRSLVVCDHQRAEAWKVGLRRRGFDVMVVETPPGHDRGGWEVGVADAHATAARAFVADVMEGRARLGRAAPSVRALVAIVVVVVLLFVWLAR